MSKFKIGDKVRLLPGRSRPQLQKFIGSEGIITSIYESGGRVWCETDIMVLWDERLVAVETCLEKILPPKEKTTDWGAIEKLTGWNPEKIAHDRK